MKLSRKIVATLTTACLLLTSMLPVSAASQQNADVAPTEAAEETRTNCALTKYGGEIYLGDGTANDPNSNSSAAACLNDGKTTASWNNWFNDCEIGNVPYPDYAVIGVNFNGSYTVDEVKLYVVDETSMIPDKYEEVGVYAPEEIIVEYWNSEKGEFVEAARLTGDEIQGNVEGDAENAITFNPVKTTKIQAKLKSAQSITYPEGRLRAVGLSEFEVFTSEPVEEVEGPVVEAPPVAQKAYQLENTTVNLNWTYDEEQANPGQGPWKFLYEKPDQAPAGDAENQDFDFSDLEGENWEPVIVPSELLLQDFDIKNNQEYYYQREITIPADYDTDKNNVIIRFDGVYSNARVWIDNHYIRTHKGGFTTWAADITEFVEAGKTVTLTVGVADILGNNKSSVWNPTGANLSDPSGAADYANHNIGGITRDVTLEVQPKDYVASVYTENVFADTAFAEQDYSQMDLEIKARANIHTTDADTKMVFTLIDPDGVTVDTASVNFATAEQGFTKTGSTSIHVDNPKLWDAEHPYLYTLESTIVVNGTEVETTSQRLGLREVLFGGKNGSDVNKVYINGKEIKLRGVCRHDISWKTGRSMSREEAYSEISDYKDANVNFIRTSHYQVSRHLLDACDEMGIYVEEENASCWAPKGTPNETEGYMTGLKEQIGRDINRPSILIWSLGNESSWAPMYRLGYEYVKETDPNRAVVFSYPTTINDGTELDLFSVHYDNWNSPNLGSPDMPVLHDEYAPSAVHHYLELQRDLNVRNFWAESIYRQWTNVFEADGALGGAIWCGGDDVFYLSDKVTKQYGCQGDYDGLTAGAGSWGVVRDHYQRLKPEAALLKKGYSPIRMDEESFRFNGERLAVPVKNWYNHTNFSELTLEYSIDGGDVQTANMPDLDPREAGEIVLDINNAAAKQVNLKFYSTFNGERMLVDEFNVNLVVTSYEFIPASGEAPELAQSDDAITIKGTSDDGEAFEVAFSKTTGLMDEARLGDQVMITGGPYFHATYVNYDNWTPAETDGITAEIVDNMAVVTLNGAYENGQGVKFVIKISKNGIINTTYELTTDPNLGRSVKELGFSYDIPADMESVSWARSAYHSVYPEDHIGRIEGTALKERPDSDTTPDPYGEVKPDWGWEMDMNDYSIFYKDDPRDGIVTNDFKCMRENVWYYDVNYPNTDRKIRVESADASASPRVEVMPDYEFVDDRDSRIQYTGDWTAQTGDILADGGDGGSAAPCFFDTEMVTNTDGTSCELTFEGTGVSIVSARQPNLGWIKVSIDGEYKKDIPLYAPWGRSKQRFVYCINGLEDGTHTVKVERINGWITIDGFAVVDSETPAQRSRLIIDQDYYYPNINWGSYPGEPVYIEKGTTGSASIRLTSGEAPTKVETPVSFVDVTDITGLPDTMAAGSTVQLNGQLVPADATSKEITYSIKDAGATEASIKGKALTALKPGVVVVTASVQNLNETFTKDFAISVRNNVALASNGSVMYVGPGTESESGHPVSYLNDGNIGGSNWGNFNWDHYVNNDYPETATVGVTFAEEYAVDSIELSIIDDGGGCFPPAGITVQYWDEEAQEFVDVPNQSKTTGFAGGLNKITFDPVSTTKLQAVMKLYKDDINGRGVAMTEFVVYEVAPAPVLDSITLTGPTKTEYFVGEELDKTGLVVTAHYSDNSSRAVTGYEVSGFNSSKAGKNTVTVSYTEDGETKTDSFEVTIKEKPVDVVLESISITGPTQTEYFVGEKLNETGLAVTANYSDGTSKKVTGYQVSGFDSSKAGKNTVTVSYTEGDVTKTASFDLTVKEKDGTSSGNGSSSGDGTSSGDGSSTGDGTQTGDTAPIVIVTIVMLIALAGSLALVLRKRAKNQ